MIPQTGFFLNRESLKGVGPSAAAPETPFIRVAGTRLKKLLHFMWTPPENRRRNEQIGYRHQVLGQQYCGEAFRRGRPHRPPLAGIRPGKFEPKPERRGAPAAIQISRNMEVFKMEERKLNAEMIAAYGGHLRLEERAPGTLEKYLRDIRQFAAWLDGETVTKDHAVAWKGYLLSRQYAPSTVNGMLAALNGLFRFFGWNDCKVKPLKRQRSVFRSGERELTTASAGRCQAGGQ